MNWIKLLSGNRPGEKKRTEDKQRNRYEQDYDRIIFSHPFRMLQDKTQVFPLPKQDFVHTRLTHSLEVASVGRSLGKLSGDRIIEKYREISNIGITSSDFGAIVSAASLMHDLGNPPFGHAGENAISEFFRKEKNALQLKGLVSEKEWHDLVNFEGNAQGFRLVNKKNFQGLSLTYATLGAFTKYPRESKIEKIYKGRKSQKKYGFLQSNKNVFKALAQEIELVELGDDDNASWCRHPLAFLVEAADDICYNIIDLEDGTNLGLVTLDETKELLGSIIGNAFDNQKFEKIRSKKERISILRAMSIQELIHQCVDKFVEVEEALLTGEFDEALTDCIPAKETMKEIQSLSFSKIYKSQPVIEREIAGFEVLNGLLETFIPPVLSFHNENNLSWHHSSLLKLFPEEHIIEIRESRNIYEALLIMLDFITGMTDSYALALYRNIKGISMPGN